MVDCKRGINKSLGYNMMGCCAGVNYYEGAEFVRSSLARDQDVIIDFTALQQVFAFFTHQVLHRASSNCHICKCGWRFWAYDRLQGRRI